VYLTFGLKTYSSTNHSLLRTYQAQLLCSWNFQRLTYTRSSQGQGLNTQGQGLENQGQQLGLQDWWSPGECFWVYSFGKSASVSIYRILVVNLKHLSKWPPQPAIRHNDCKPYHSAVVLILNTPEIIAQHLKVCTKFCWHCDRWYSVVFDFTTSA